MFGMRKFAVNGARIALRRNGAASAGSFRSMSSLLDSKERGEEAIYFQHEDARLKHEMRMKMEKILELDDDHEEKKELVDLLSTYFSCKATLFWFIVDFDLIIML